MFIVIFGLGFRMPDTELVSAQARCCFLKARSNEQVERRDRSDLAPSYRRSTAASPPPIKRT